MERNTKGKVTAATGGGAKRRSQRSELIAIVKFTEADMPKVRMTLGIGIANANQEEIIDIDAQEWADCETDKEREDLLEQYWADWMNNYLDGGYEVIDE